MSHHARSHTFRLEECNSIEHTRDSGDDCELPVWKGPKCQMRQSEQHRRTDQTDGFAPHSTRQQPLQEGSKEKFLSQRHHPQKSEESSDHKKCKFPPFQGRWLETSEVQQISDGRAHRK